MSPGASLVWDELAPLCLAMGTLTSADVRAFTMLCELEVTVGLARRWKADPEKLTEGLKLEKEFAPIMRPYYALFGLDPVSRARIQVVPTAEPVKERWPGLA